MLDQFFGAAWLALEGVGVLVIVGGSLLAAVHALLRVCGSPPNAVYRELRRNMGRSIMLGLEFLIAGDIIRTVVVADTLSAVAVLGVVIVIRSLLSFTLFLETENRLPWQARHANSGGHGVHHANGHEGVAQDPPGGGHP